MKAAVRAREHPSFIAGQVRKYRYFFLNLIPSPRSKLAVACGGWESCAPDYRIDRSDFAFYGIEYVASGNGTLMLNGIESELRPGVVFAYRPFTPHIIRTSPDDPLVKYFIDFSGKEARRLVSGRIFGRNGLAYLHHEHAVHDLFEEILNTGLKGGRLAPRACALMLDMLALRIEESAHGSAPAQSRARQSFERCRTALQEHFCTLRSVSELGQLTNLDPAYLSRLFLRFGGESPHEALTRLKMNEAAAHLTGGRFSVKEVAAQVGFPDPYHFSRAFKRHYGMAPIQFRHARAKSR